MENIKNYHFFGKLSIKKPLILRDLLILLEQVMGRSAFDFDSIITCFIKKNYHKNYHELYLLYAKLL